jgi:hypothetical protein
MILYTMIFFSKQPPIAWKMPLYFSVVDAIALEREMETASERDNIFYLWDLNNNLNSLLEIGILDKFMCDYTGQVIQKDY